MRCRRVEQFLSDRLERPLAAREADAVAAHLRDCPACRRRAGEFAAAGADLRALAQHVSPPALEQSVVERWLAEREAVEAGQSICRAITARHGRIALATAGAACATMAALILAGRIGIRQPPRNEVASSRLITGSTEPPAAGRKRPACPPQRPVNGPGNTGPSRIPSRLQAAYRPDRLPVYGGTNRWPEDSLDSRGSNGGGHPSANARDDLIYLNPARGASPRPRLLGLPGERSVPAARTVNAPPVRDDFVTIPLPRIAAGGPAADRAAADAAAAYEREVAVVDARLARPVTLQQKATALADLCEHLRAGTGINLTAGPSVADEKVTLFCKQQPLRDVMRQLSRPFGYTWLRSGKAGEYRYELVQDLRSQLLEEELRNRDRNAALLALDDAMIRFHPYVGLPPDELRKRALETGPAGPKLPKHLAGTGWGPLQLYFRLAPRDLDALRAGQKLTFSAAPGPGAQQLPPDLIRGVLESVPDRRIRRRGDEFDVGPESSLPDGLPPASVPEARAMVTLQLDWSELGQLTLVGQSGFFIGTPPDCPQILGDDGPIAVGVSPTVRDPENAVVNVRLARDPTLRPPVTVRPRSSCGSDLSPSPSPKRGGEPGSPSGMPQSEGAQGDKSDGVAKKLPIPASGDRSRRTEATPGGHRPRSGWSGEVNPPKVTTADVLEALHQATGLPIVADYYTRLYPATAMPVQKLPCFDALNRLADTMRMRWTKADGWLQLRSASFFNDRLKEVPNRLLTRWMASRREHGALTLDDLVEIAQLSDAQLASDVMAEGAETCFELAEWRLGRNGWLRPFWRFLATLTPAQRLQAASATGLAFRQMTLVQQQQFIALAVPHEVETMSAALEDLAEASLRLDYRLPGSHEWKVPAPAGGAGWRGLMPSPVRERTREEALRAARRIDARADETQIVPTELTLTMIYSLGGPHARFTPLVIRADPHNTLGAPPRRSTEGS